MKRFSGLHPLLTKVNQKQVKETRDYRNGPIVIRPISGIRARENGRLQMHSNHRSHGQGYRLQLGVATWYNGKTMTIDNNYQSMNIFYFIIINIFYRYKLKCYFIFSNKKEKVHSIHVKTNCFKFIVQ